MTSPTLLDRLTDRAPELLAALPVALGIMVAAFVTNLFLGRILGVLASRTYLTDDDLMPFRRILSWVVRALALILILGVLGFQIGGIWAMLSTILGLVAIGFVAVWSILSHTTATFLLLLLRPFHVGDDLEFAGEPVRGRVIDLNFFFTTLIDHDGVLHQIPNNLFFQKSIKRRKNTPLLSLAAQLNLPHPAEVTLPPDYGKSDPGGKVAPPDPMMNYPDPASYSPPSRTK